MSLTTIDCGQPQTTVFIHTVGNISSHSVWLVEKISHYET